MRWLDIPKLWRTQHWKWYVIYRRYTHHTLCICCEELVPFILNSFIALFFSLHLSPQVFQHCAESQRINISANKNAHLAQVIVLDDVDSGSVPLSKKRKAGGNTAINDATQAHEELLSWVDVLQSLQSNTEKATHRHNRHVEVNATHFIQP